MHLMIVICFLWGVSEGDRVELNSLLDVNLKLARHIQEKVSRRVEQYALAQLLGDTRVTSGDTVYSGVTVQSVEPVVRYRDSFETVWQDEASAEFNLYLNVPRIVYQIESLKGMEALGIGGEITDFTVTVTNLNMYLWYRFLPDASSLTGCGPPHFNPNLSIQGKAVLGSGHAFYNGMDVTEFFKNTFIASVQTSFQSKVKSALVEYSLVCDSPLFTLTKSLSAMVSI